jgi:hypothetical protein
MLKAIIHGKAGRIEHNQDESVSWSSLFKAREDLLTSTVFERFAYLSDKMQKDMLLHWFKAHYGDIPTDFGELQGISYWPRFTHEHDQGSNLVEPDLIIHFDQCNIIIEVKPPAGGDQYLWQWQKEIASFLQSEDNPGTPLYFLAIGRVEQANTKRWATHLLKQFEQLQGIAALKWAVVTEHIIELTSEDGTDSKPQLSKQDRYILLDILEGLSLYGLQTSPFKWGDLAQCEHLPSLMLEHDLFKPLVLNVSRMDALLNYPFAPLDLQKFQTGLKE